MLFTCSSSCVPHFAGPGAKRVHAVLPGLRMRLSVRVHACISCRHDWMFASDMSMSLCVDATVMPSAHAVSLTGACGAGVSDVYMLKSVCDSTPPCGTPPLS